MKQSLIIEREPQEVTTQTKNDFHTAICTWGSKFRQRNTIGSKNRKYNDTTSNKLCTQPPNGAEKKINRAITIRKSVHSITRLLLAPT